jgi:phosphoenolpyruvate mutase
MDLGNGSLGKLLMSKVYVGMCADLIHHGHLNIIKEARKYGEVIVGLLTDSAIAGYKRLPALSYEERKIVVENIVGVSKVIPQKTLDYIPNIEELKPDYVVHGDDWKEGVQKQVRQKVIDKLKEWGGEVIDVPYTKGVSSTKLHNHLKEIGTTPDIRRKMLKRLLDFKPIVRVLEAHNGLTGLIVEKTKVGNDEFDAMWLSSLTHSASKGKPDNQYVDITTVSQTLSEIFDVTTKPMIVDLDNGGMIEHFKFTIRTLERMGVSAVIIEDKVGSKRNSLFENTSNQTQDKPSVFGNKISKGKKSLVTKEFMIIARIESFILGKGVVDAVDRAYLYIESGADGIMIHSKREDISEILSFCEHYKKFRKKVPLVVVPSTYNRVVEKELIDMGVDIVIYANQLLRSSYPAMIDTAQSILENKRSYEASKNCLSIKKVLELIPND